MANVADTAIAWAMAQVGKPYCWGGTGPSCFDCSGLVQQAYKAAGVNMPRVVPDQMHWCWSKGSPHLTQAQLLPGDLVAPYATFEHIQIYLGSNKIVEAPHTGADVRVIPMWGFAYGARVVPGGGTGVAVGVSTSNPDNQGAGLCGPLITGSGAATAFALFELFSHIHF